MNLLICFQNKESRLNAVKTYTSKILVYVVFINVYEVYFVPLYSYRH
jgi:hypothetical protein